MSDEALLRSATWRDYLELSKPRVVLLMLLCALVGMLLARPETLPGFELILLTLLGIALMAASAAAVNHIADAELDARMTRTRSRPVVAGRVSVRQGLTFSLLAGIAGFWLLHTQVNPLTAWLNLGSWVGYALIYTLFLKRATPQNIVIGGLFGAAPPLFGWTAVTGVVEPGGVLLVWIIFVWTPPHFWALALDRKEDYVNAGVPMLPVTHGEQTTRWYILGYTVALVVSSLLPVPFGLSGMLYLAAALLLGGVFLFKAVEVVRHQDDGAPMAAFRYSILYLMLLFMALITDRYLSVLAGFG